MTDEEYTLQLGKLVVNLQTLEFLIRATLDLQPEAIRAPEGEAIYRVPINTILTETNFTSFDSLSQLVAKFNRLKGREEPLLAKAVALRDAIAHGRVLSLVPKPPLSLVKFSRPELGKVRVEFSALMDARWFREQIEMLNDAMQLVQTTLGK